MREFPVNKRCQGIRSSEKVTKVTEYVERPRHNTQLGPNSHHSFVVLETEQGNKIITERLMDGTVTWEENPTDLEDRNSLAKVVRSADCHNMGSTTIHEMKNYQSK